MGLPSLRQGTNDLGDGRKVPLWINVLPTSPTHPNFLHCGTFTSLLLTSIRCACYQQPRQARSASPQNRRNADAYNVSGEEPRTRRITPSISAAMIVRIIVVLHTHSHHL